MDLTVREVLALPELKECQLLSQGVSCLQKVESVTVMDSPEILDWVAENEILLSNGTSLEDFTNEEWIEFFDGLSERKAAALFIKLHYHVQSIPEAVIEHTEDIDFPIVVVPNSYSWVQLSRPIHQVMIEQQFYFLNESLNLRNLLNRTMARGGSVEDVCRAAAKDMGCEIAVFDSDGWARIGSTESPVWDTVARSLYARRGTKATGARFKPLSPEEFRIEADQGEVVLQRLADRAGKYYAAYWSEQPRPAAKELDAFKAEQINSALLLCLCKDEDINRIEQHYYIDFLNELVDGTLTDTEDILAKTKRLGRSVHKTYQLAVFGVDPSTPYDLLTNMVDRFKTSTDPAIRDIMYCQKESRLVLFLPFFEKENRELVEQACLIAQDCLGIEGAWFGVSQPYSIEQLATAFCEATFAQSMHAVTLRTIVFYADLGLLRLFERNAHHADTPFIKEFYSQVMGDLIAYDEENHSNLVETLRVYLQHNESVAAAAKALFVHENTLRMRIKRIEQITGRSAHSMMDNVELSLGIIMHEFIEHRDR